VAYPEPRPFQWQSDSGATEEDLAILASELTRGPASTDFFRQLARDILAILVEERSTIATAGTTERTSEGAEKPPVSSRPVDEMVADIHAICSELLTSQTDIVSTAALETPSSTAAASTALISDILRALETYSDAVSRAKPARIDD
jgi:hypothetical protein